MTVVYTPIGYGITDENGVAKLEKDMDDQDLTHSYTGTGAGEIDIVSSLDDPDTINESSIQSEPYTLVDAIVKDIGKSSDHNDSLWNSVSELTRGDTGTTANLTSQIYTAQYDVGVACEFDLSDIETVCRVQIARYQTGETTTYHYYDFTSGAVRIEVTANQIIFKLDGTVKQTIDNTTNNKFRFFFNIPSGQTPKFKFKNLRIYPL